MFNEMQNEFDLKVRQIAENSLIKKLNEKGISRNEISPMQFENLLNMEIEIIKSDGKKIGTGIGVGIALSILTGGLF